MKDSVDEEGNPQCTLVELQDREFPIEDALVPPLIELIVKELAPAVFRPEDDTNNAADDLAKVGLATAKK